MGYTKEQKRNFALNLKSWLERSTWTKGKFAKKAGIHPKTLEGYLHGTHFPAGEAYQEGIRSAVGDFDALLRPPAQPQSWVPSFSPKPGVHLLREFPVPARAGLHDELAWGLRDQKFQFVPIGAPPSVDDFWERFAESSGREGNPRGLRSWVDSCDGLAAIVLAGFMGSQSLVEAESESALAACDLVWKRFGRLVSDTKSVCSLVLVQAVNPLHDPVVSSVSCPFAPTMVAAPPIDMTDGEPDPVVLLAELPPCCIRWLLWGEQTARTRECPRELEVARICKIDEDGVLQPIELLRAILEQIRSRFRAGRSE